MFDHETRALLKDQIPFIPEVVIAPSLRIDMDELLAALLPSGRVALVDDADTALALGDALYRAIRQRYEVVRIDCGKRPQADTKLVDALKARSRRCDLIVAVGAGTINDLCKFAAHEDNKPYVVFPTAASMNGYLSATASLSDSGYKRSVPASLPRAVYCDLSVIAQAPARLAKSGLGDSLARPSAQADWLLSHLLLGTPYSTLPFALTATREPQLLQQSRGVALRDAQSIRLLLEVLLLSGLGMTVAGGSYPASQSEHMLAHAFEMLGAQVAPTLHGEQIGVTALLALHSYASLLTKVPVLKREDFPFDGVSQHYGQRVAEEALPAYTLKQQRIDQSGLTNRSIRERWPDVAERVSSVLLSAEAVQQALVQAQAPHRLEMLGWGMKDFTLAARFAPFLRDRFTCLDLSPG